MSGSGLLRAETKLGGCAEIFGSEVVGEKLGPCSSGDHGGVVSGQSHRRKGDGDAGGCGVADNLVVDVGDVHDVVERDALLTEDAAEDIDVEEGAEVADVAVVVDGGAAAVHAQCGCADWGEGLDLAAESVEKFDRSHVLSVPAAAGAWRGADCSRLRFPS